jgi:DNA polymerase III alpha subunit
MADNLRDAFDCRLHGVLMRHREVEDALRESRLRDRAREYGIPLAAASEVLYHTPARAPLQDVLTCVRHSVTLSTSSRYRKLNDNHALLSPYGFAKLYRDDDAAVRRTEEIAEQCTFSLNEIRYRYPLERLPDGSNPAEWLNTVTMEGAQKRYGVSVPKDVRRQLETSNTRATSSRCGRLSGTAIITTFYVRGAALRPTPQSVIVSALRRLILYAWVCYSSGFYHANARNRPTWIWTLSTTAVKKLYNMFT